MCSTSLEVSSILSQVCVVPVWKSPASCHRYVQYQPGSLQHLVTCMCSTSLDVSSILSQVCVVPVWKSPASCHRYV
ncbi:hypothetical protein DPMN_120758 [Dreissena polymorpha]|uniref:Uncharacterized protein n=1 Tax=Dreissena polymorpha TaxID=45954 RepID=A0A9D4GNX5_DREPO|nr:hypothetical protein DPMN_120758 [Dreissena polymorpha]